MLFRAPFVVPYRPAGISRRNVGAPLVTPGRPPHCRPLSRRPTEVPCRPAGISRRNVGAPLVTPGRPPHCRPLSRRPTEVPCRPAGLSRRNVGAPLVTPGRPPHCRPLSRRPTEVARRTKKSPFHTVKHTNHSEIYTIHTVKQTFRRRAGFFSAVLLFLSAWASVLSPCP